MITSADAFAALQPLVPLPEYPTVPLEQDFTMPSFLSRREIDKLRELQCLDSLQEAWDPHTAVIAVLDHRLTRYARRQPGKHSYDASTPLIISKGVRVLVKFFDESKSWFPMEAIAQRILSF
jgi:hypothetical protein